LIPDFLLFVVVVSLEEYLQDLAGFSSLAQSQDDTVAGGEPSASSQSFTSTSTTTPNFAHAALILQNSSSVYGRKVEYLHGLVYKALNEFFKSTSSTNNKESRRKSTDAAIEEFYGFDPHMDFLLLDDVVPEDMTNQKSKINLKEEDDDDLDLDHQEQQQQLGGCSPPNNQSMQNRTRLSLGGLSVTRVERSSTTIGVGGIASSAQQRALLGALNNGSLRLFNGRCDVGDDGVLLMPGSQSSSATTATAMEHDGGGRRSLFGNEAVMPIDLPQLEKDEYDDDDDHSNDGAGFEMQDDDNHEEPPPRALEEDGEQVHSVVVAVPLQQRQQGTDKRVAFQEPKKRADPWALLDPHSSETTQKPKALRKGKTYRLPDGIDQPPSECVTGARTRRMPQRRLPSTQQEVRLSLVVETFRAHLHKQGDAPKIPMNGLMFGGEFAYIAKETAKKRAATRREQRKLQDQQQQQQPYDDGHEVYEEDEDGGGYDFGGEDDYDDDNNDMGNAGINSLDDAFQNAADNHDGECCTSRTKMISHLICILTFSLPPKMLQKSRTWVRPLKSFVGLISRRSPRVPKTLH
jgi:hypothetical protein